MLIPIIREHKKVFDNFYAQEVDVIVIPKEIQPIIDDNDWKKDFISISKWNIKEDDIKIKSWKIEHLSRVLLKYNRLKT